MLRVSLKRFLSIGALLVASSSFGACRYNEMAALPLSIQPDGAPVLDVRVNNAVVPMLVDTGYRRTVLTKTETDRQQLPLIHSKTPGHPDVLTAQPDEVVIGTVRARHHRL
jgi:predicted aspartyl protease